MSTPIITKGYVNLDDLSFDTSDWLNEQSLQIKDEVFAYGNISQLNDSEGNIININNNIDDYNSSVEYM